MTSPIRDRSARPRSRRGALICFTCLLSAAVLVPWAATAATTAEPIQSHELAAGARAEILADGTVWVRSPAGAVDQNLLKMATTLRTSRPLRRSEDWVYTTQRREGDEGGHRGFSPHADDDGDGRVDEERLDGRDNDGDGRIDEDYAAIGDGMTAVGNMHGGRALFLETYHWDYPHLRETLVTSWRREGRDGEPQRDHVTLELPFGIWQEMTVGWDASRHAEAGAGAASEMMMVASLPRDGGRWWIGVTVLAMDSGDPPRVDGRRLELPCNGTLVCAVSVTTTLSQLRHQQATAHAVHAGAPAVPGQPAVPWIVPPLPQVGAGEEPLFATWEHEHVQESDGWRLSLDIPAGCSPLIDPESMCADMAQPGTPTHVSWRGQGTDADDAWDEPWPSPDHAELWRADASPHPFRTHLTDLRSRTGGTLTFHYAGTAMLGEKASLTCRTIWGQDVRIEVARAADPSSGSNSPAKGKSSIEASDESVAKERESRVRPPSLSPALLDNFPNPFHDQTRLRYKIPATVGEGFVWDEGQEPTLKADDPIPYQSDSPSVSLKVYTVAGHEVVALFDGICPIGTYQTTWDGNDQDGRPVAVGTYFCKLQIENWSVTKRVALLR